MQAAMILLMTENAAAGSCYTHDLLLHLFFYYEIRKNPVLIELS